MSAKPDFDVLIAGAGFSGLGMAIALKREGARSFVVLEKAGAIGGTWRDNHYPGSACDIPSNLYSFSFAPNPDWTRFFPQQQEIWDYMERVTDRYDLRPHIRLNTALASAHWNDAARLWDITTKDGNHITARVFISGMGGLHVPHMPDLPGIETFKGPSWHSAAWRDDVQLAGRRVALIGGGASAIQIVPQIAPLVSKLDLYQRTPQWIVPRGDSAVPGWLRATFRFFPPAQQIARLLVYGINEARAPAFLQPLPGETLGMKFARKHLQRQIEDPILREKLTPAYRMGCKRVLVSDDFYPAVARANVELIVDGVREVRANGVVDCSGVERPADVIVYATGFKAMDIVSNVEIIGAGGRKLADAWSDGPEAYYGAAVSGFPNFFTLLGPNSALGHNSVIYMIESQVRFVMDALRKLDAKDADALDVKSEAQAAFNAEIHQRLEKSVWGSGCKSWYVTESGKNYTLWPDYTFKFRARTKHIRDEDFDFTPAPVSPAESLH